MNIPKLALEPNKSRLLLTEALASSPGDHFFQNFCRTCEIQAVIATYSLEALAWRTLAGERNREGRLSQGVVESK